MASLRSGELLRCDTTAEKARQDRPALLHSPFAACGEAQIALEPTAGHNPQSLTYLSCGKDFILRRSLREQRASKDAPDCALGAALAPWSVLRGPFGAPQDEGGGCRDGVVDD